MYPTFAILASRASSGRRVIALSLGILGLLGCGGGGPSGPSQPTPVSAQPTPAPQPTPTPGNAGPFDGTWAGSGFGSFSGGQIGFTVANSTVTVITLTGIGCSKTYSVTSNTRIAESGALEYSTVGNPNPDVSLSMSGQFRSPTFASGTMTVTYKSDYSGSAFTSWSASKS